MVTTLALGMVLVAQQDPHTFPTGKLTLESFTTLAGEPLPLPVPNKKATVVIFVSAVCPIANRYTPEILRLQAEFVPKGVTFVRAYIDPAASREELIQHTESFGLTMPALWDEGFRLTRAVGATVTPECAVISPDSRLLYRGRIDDRYLEHGNVKEGGDYRHDLRIALEETLAGKPVSERANIPWGCYIPFD